MPVVIIEMVGSKDFQQPPCDYTKVPSLVESREAARRDLKGPKATEHWKHRRREDGWSHQPSFYASRTVRTETPAPK